MISAGMLRRKKQLKAARGIRKTKVRAKPIERHESKQLSHAEAMELVANNLGLADFAVKYVRCPAWIIEKEDQFQIACLGMVKGAPKYDPSRSKFSTFATRCAINELKHERDALLLERRGGGNPARGLGKKKTKIGRYVDVFHDTPDDHVDGLELLESEDVWTTSMMMLNQKERKIIKWRFRDGEKLEQIAARMGCSRQNVQQSEQSALKWIRAVIKQREVAIEREREIRKFAERLFG